MAEFPITVTYGEVSGGPQDGARLVILEIAKPGATEQVILSPTEASKLAGHLALAVSQYLEGSR